MNKRIILSLCLATATLVASAQETMPVTTGGSDVGTDISIEVEKRLAPGISLSLEGNHRSQNDVKSTDRWQVGTELGFRICRSENKKLSGKGGVGFVYTWKQNLEETKEHFNNAGIMNGYNSTESYYRQRYRINVSIGATYAPSKRWQFALKETFQYNHYNSGDSVCRTKYRYNDDDELYAISDRKAVEAKDKMLMRSKFTVAYNIKGLPLNPFASVEYCAGQGNTERWKYTGGLDFRVNKQNKLTVFYRYQTTNDDEDPNGHIVGWAYKFDF